MEKSSNKTLEIYLNHLQFVFKSNYIYLATASQSELQIISNFIKDDTNYIMLFKCKLIKQIFRRQLEDLIKIFDSIRELFPINNESLKNSIGRMIEMIMNIRISIFYFLCHEYSFNLKNSPDFYLELGNFDRGLNLSFQGKILNELSDYIKNFKESVKFNDLLVGFEKSMHLSAVCSMLNHLKLCKMNNVFDMIEVIAMLNLLFCPYRIQKLGLVLMVDLINEYAQPQNEYFIINREKLSQLVKAIWSSKSSLASFLNKMKTYKTLNDLFMILLPDKSNAYLSNNKLKELLNQVLFKNLLSIKLNYSYPEYFLSIYGDGIQQTKLFQ